MSEHTPGPWKVRDRSEIYAAGYFVGSTRGIHPEPESVMLQDEANARLIASAPDLLSVAQYAAKMPDSDNMPEWAKELRHHARAAVAKATQR